MQKHAFFVWVLQHCKSRAITKSLLVMKLTTAILISFILNASANGFSQTVTFSGKNVPFAKVLNAVEKQANVFFFYDAELLKLAKPVTIQVSQVELKDFLNTLFKEQPLEYHMDNQLVVVTKKKNTGIAIVEDKTVPGLLQEQPPVLIRGRITNETGEPVMASVVVKGTSTGPPLTAMAILSSPFRIQMPRLLLPVLILMPKR